MKDLRIRFNIYTQKYEVYYCLTDCVIKTVAQLPTREDCINFINKKNYVRKNRKKKNPIRDKSAKTS